MEEAESLPQGCRGESSLSPSERVAVFLGFSYLSYCSSVFFAGSFLPL